MSPCTIYQTGQSLTEYLTALVIVAVLLGFGSQEGSIVHLFLNEVRNGFEGFSGFISLPL